MKFRYLYVKIEIIYAKFPLGYADPKNLNYSLRSFIVTVLMAEFFKADFIKYFLTLTVHKYH